MKVCKNIVRVAFCVICFLFTIVFCGALAAVISFICKGAM
ncbi:hypothetical protein ECK4_1090 [Escherichia coli O5:K4(L):H4 str. ATCC 23502]|nr:putative membrane protein [Escherichia coli 2-156-04_S3_C2]CCP99720.1 hypothetical protein ECK4_1090 [Escherichia coli O5:K4(L):H4 str. ATCC 23502]